MARHGFRRQLGRFSNRGHADHERAPEAGSLAVRFNRAALRLDERLHQRESDTKPSRERSCDVSACTNISKSRGSRSAAIPMPLSRTRITACPVLFHGQPWPPASVNLQALFRRLPTT